MLWLRNRCFPPLYFQSGVSVQHTCNLKRALQSVLVLSLLDNEPPVARVSLNKEGGTMSCSLCLLIQKVTALAERNAFALQTRYILRKKIVLTDQFT